MKILILQGSSLEIGPIEFGPGVSGVIDTSVEITAEPSNVRNLSFYRVHYWFR